jgi:BirA family biotin operon repressor/biotin-[acetyl-CoA-carboxylase] ligase
MTGWPDGYGRIVVPEVGSTLDEAVRRASEHPAPFWLMAERQTAARGRRGRPWLMPEGNFAATLVLDLPEPPGRAALRSFAMSLALLQVLEAVTGAHADIALKWPNDVLMGGGKVAGILLEKPGVSDLLAIGVGVNLAAAPAAALVEPGALRPVCLREETGVGMTPEAFLDRLAATYAPLEAQMRAEGFAPIRDRWLARATRLGETVTARVGRESVTGIFEDVDAEGHLVLRGPGGPRAIAAADIYF